MSLWSHLQKRDEMNELKRRDDIEERKLKVMQQEQKSGKGNLKYCPIVENHCHNFLIKNRVNASVSEFLSYPNV